MSEYFIVGTLFSSYLYYSVTCILGYNSIWGDFFSKYIGIVFVIVMLFGLYSCLVEKRRLVISQWSLALVTFLIISLAIPSYSNDVDSFKFISVTYIVPPIFLGLIRFDSFDKKKLYRACMFCMILFTVATTLFLARYIIDGSVTLRRGFGSGTYQNAGYCAAFAFTLNLFLCKWNEMVKFCLLILQFISCMVSSASGPFVVCIVSVILYMFFYEKREFNIKRLLRFLIIPLILIVMFNILKNGMFREEFQRVSSMFSLSGGIDLEEAGRKNVFDSAISMIKAHPLGCGLFEYYSYLGYYPHNLFLEVLLQGGVLYALFIAIASGFMAKKYVIDAKKDSFEEFMRPIFIVNFIMLMVSGTYMYNPIFWLFYVML